MSKFVTAQMNDKVLYEKDSKDYSILMLENGKHCWEILRILFLNLKFTKMKKNILMACYFINILMVSLVIITILAALFRFKDLLDYVFFDETFLQIRMVLTIPILVLWLNNIIVWSKNDKKIGRFLLLFFLNGLYNPFYYRKI